MKARSKPRSSLKRGRSKESKTYVGEFAFCMIIIFFALICFLFTGVSKQGAFKMFNSGIFPTFAALEFLLKSHVAIDGRNSIQFGGTCNKRANMEGNHQRVISYSAFGSNDGYWAGIPAIMDQIKQIYPGWFVRIHTDKLDAVVIRDLMRNSSYSFVHFCDVSDLPPPIVSLENYPGKLWRFFPLADPQVDIVIFRDTDSEVSFRERDAVMDWLSNSSKSLHVMRDHPYHGIPMLGGMWGARITKDNRRIWKAIRDTMFIKGFRSFTEPMFGLDQHLLHKLVWPYFKNDCTAHDSYTCTYFKGSIPWPTKRPENRHFVGSRDFRQETEGLKEECPLVCRPQIHQDWLYC